MPAGEEVGGRQAGARHLTGGKAFSSAEGKETLMIRTAFTAALLFALPAFAQTTDTGNGATTVPPTANSTTGTTVTGAIDAPKTRTTGNERVQKGTTGASSPSSDLNATAATQRKHHHRRVLPPH